MDARFSEVPMGKIFKWERKTYIKKSETEALSEKENHIVQFDDHILVDYTKE